MATEHLDTKVGELDDAIVNGAPKVAAGVTAEDELPAEPSSLTEAASRDHDAQSGSFTLKPRPSTEQGAAAAAASARAEADDRPGPAAAEDQPTGEQQQEEEKEEEQQQAAGAAAQAAKAVSGVSQVRRNDILGSTKGSMGRGAPVNPNAEVVRASDTADEVRSPPVKVTDLSKQLKEQFGAGAPSGSEVPPSREGNSLVAAAPRSASGASLTQHDLVNTANVALVLQAGEFKLRPGVDVVPYEQLTELRLEDGLDVSRKEEYLSSEEFEKVFGMDKAEFAAMPAWKRISTKKAKGLF